MVLSSELTAKTNRPLFVCGLDYAITYLLMLSTRFHGNLGSPSSREGLLKIETASSCNMLVPNYQSALGDHWENYNLNLHQFENFMSEDHRDLSFIHSTGMCRMRQFLAVLRSFFHSSL